MFKYRFKKMILNENTNIKNELYHATNYKNLVNILKMDILKTSPGFQDQLSFSQNYKFAKSWSVTVIVFNRRKLESDYKLIPYDFYQDDLEYKLKHPEEKYAFELKPPKIPEEELMTKTSVTNLKKYITSINIEYILLSNFKIKKRNKILLNYKDVLQKKIPKQYRKYYYPHDDLIYYLENRGKLRDV